MKIMQLHPWNVSFQEAIVIQEALRSKIILKKLSKKIRYIAGTDVSCSKRSHDAWAGVIVLNYPQLRKVDESWVKNVGAVVRTRDGVRPLFVSPGHAIEIEESIRMVLDYGGRYRIPEPIRQAHILVNKLRQKEEVS